MLRCFGWIALAAVALGTASPVRAQVGSPLIPQTTALRYGLERAWFARAAVAPHRSKLANWNLVDDRLLVQTSQNVVQSFDAETGRLFWTRQVGASYRPTLRPAASKAGVAVINNDELFLLDRESGNVLWQQRLEAVPYSPPGMNDEWVYVPLSTGKLVAYGVKDPKKNYWSSGSGGRCEFAPLVTHYGVLWVTDLGVLTASDPDQRRLQFQFEMNTPPKIQPTYWPTAVHLFDRDGNVTAVNNVEGPKNGRVLWQSQLPGPLAGQPISTADRLFVGRADKGVFCMSTTLTADVPAAGAEPAADGAAPDAAAEPAAEDVTAKPVRTRPAGEVEWFAAGIRQVLAIGPNRIYASDDFGNLALLDPKTGGRSAVMPIPGFTVQLVNHHNDRVYVATPDGLIHCFHDVAAPQPVVHQWPPKDKPKEQTEIRVGDEPAETN